MDTSALFKIDKDEVDVSEKDFHVGDLAIDDNLLVDDLSNIVLTVGELVEMYNNDETSNRITSADGKKKFETIDKNKIAKQSSSDITVDFRDVADAAEQKKCVEKVVLEEETEWDEEVKCEHRYRQHCYTTYSTAFKPFQEEECQDNYKKNCFIEFGLDAVNHTVRICKRPLVKDCTIEGDEICSTHFETECWTRHLRQEVEDDLPSCEPIVEQLCTEKTSGYSTNEECNPVTRLKCKIEKKVSYKFKPVTECKLSPVEICAPAGCGVKEGPEECYDRRTLVVYDKPEESCNLESFKRCEFVTKLVPHLKDKEECVDVPLEICVRYDTNPRLVNKPVLKVWCYKATKEAGLARR